MHEIVTLQLGQRSNYLATHFWNAQESYFTYGDEEQSPIDHNIHFRQGIGADGSDTFTPRTVIYDLKGGFGSMRKINALYEMEDEPGLQQGLWDGGKAIQRDPTIEKSDYQRSLDEGLPPPPLTTETVRYWSDFNRVFYHPRSIVQLNDYELNSKLMPFENWDMGEELFSSLDKEHDLLDRDLRPFAEECDQLQGLQLITSADDAWGGFASRYLDKIRDEYGKTSVWVWAIEDGAKDQRSKLLQRMTNSARSVHEMATMASLYIPLSDSPAFVPDWINFNQGSRWHTSALLCTALESMTIPSRLRNGKLETFSQIEGPLNVNGNQRIANLRFSVDDPKKLDAHDTSLGSGIAARGEGRTVNPTGNTSDSEEEDAGAIKDLDIDLLPWAAAPVSRTRRRTKRHVFGRVEVSRGESGDSESSLERDAAYRARQRLAGRPITERFHSGLKFPLLDSFPRIFKMSSSDEQSVGVYSSLSTESSVAVRIEALRGIVGKNVGLDERETLSNGLDEICEAYEEGWHSGSDEDDD
ncbi:tubulin nucleotide-binding domain-like protein [Xylona heveae TC161]|uniref:Tubulin nucleotide-binding domain-like protein n=1 Tax=Xylona heveae (strain CBS 132557 / TC161) TaxID=1328760 RepID=A0A165HXA6_XYLHT|nr:tubulin nucleotide-binding domain-like protein [Xylona heveae TC161]KZF24059.1 tubulin nucleotide-binding domain-like protein [Xylona heveae TC161]